MKKTLAVLMMVLMVVMLFVSCDNNAKEPEKEPEAKTYTVTFDLNGGTGDITAQRVKEGEKATKPENNPTNDNVVFKFWSLDGTTEYKFDTAIAGDTIIKAVWKTVFEIGDIGPAGGWIFYDCDADNDNTNDGAGADGLKSSVCGWRYLEASSQDSDPAASWGSTGSSYETKEGIGEGKNNTKKLMDAKAKNSSLEFTAAERYDEYSKNGYTDWFLPSEKELKLMYTNLQEKGKGDFSSADYWSSTGDNNTQAASQNFGSGNLVASIRNNEYYIRPIRSFK